MYIELIAHQYWASISMPGQLLDLSIRRKEADYTKVLHGITATGLPPCRHCFCLKRIQEEDLSSIVINEVINCLNTIFRSSNIREIDDEMPIWGNKASKVGDGFLNILNIFSCSTNDFIVKEIGISKDPLIIST